MHFYEMNLCPLAGLALLKTRVACDNTFEWEGHSLATVSGDNYQCDSSDSLISKPLVLSSISKYFPGNNVIQGGFFKTTLYDSSNSLFDNICLSCLLPCQWHWQQCLLCYCWNSKYKLISINLKNVMLEVDVIAFKFCPYYYRQEEGYILFSWNALNKPARLRFNICQTQPK